MKIEVWYHAKIDGEGVPSPDVALEVASRQLGAIRESGLAGALNEFHIGVNGGDADALLLAQLAPGKPTFHVHGAKARTEIPTMAKLRERLKPGSYILYHHTKGITHPGEASYENWRQRMEDACVWNWKDCVRDLGRGYDVAGCHWLTPERYPGAVTSPFFGGTFWWAKSDYLLQLPALPAANWQNRFEAESWIGRRRPYPKVRDYYPGWP
jgi:hypothetical protein